MASVRIVTAGGGYGGRDCYGVRVVVVSMPRCDLCRGCKYVRCCCWQENVCSCSGGIKSFAQKYLHYYLDCNQWFLNIVMS